jgi:hypothetical protein
MDDMDGNPPVDKLQNEIIPAESLSNIEFSPVVPIPLEFDINYRITLPSVESSAS